MSRTTSHPALALIIIACAISSIHAQTNVPPAGRSKHSHASSKNGTSTSADTSVNDQNQNTDLKKDKKRGTFIIAPIPISSPAIGSGLVLALGYVFKIDEDDELSRPSTVGGAGAFTNNGSRAGVLGGRLYFSENKYQTAVAIATGRVNFDFYGIGRIPGAEPLKVPLTGGGKIFFGEFMRNIGHGIFMGPRYQYRSLYFRPDGEQPQGGFEIPAIDAKTKTAALGLHIQRDKRDSTFFPTKGSLFDATADFFDQSIGSRRQYQVYKVAYNVYRAIGDKQVFAYRGMVCSANQRAPFYDLCLFGYDNDLRGYTAGEFQNRRRFARQAEFRRQLKGRFGIVGFGGVGSIARRWNEFRSDQLLPAVGAGLRFNLDKKNHINYRIDWAVGRAGHTLSIGVGEAF